MSNTKPDSSQVKYIPAGIGAVATSVQTKLRESVSVKDFGAEGDGIADDTLAIQNALDSGAKHITGNNLEYVVTTIKPRSNQILENIRLIAKASVAQVAMRPVVMLGGVINSVVQTTSNVVLNNITINGNRTNMSSVAGGSEDGGMHGFKISSGASDIKLLNCTANYCATAGLALHSDESEVGSVATYPIKNIYVENFTGTYNREHGMFADSFDGFVINGANLSFNGLTLTSALSDIHGATGFKNAGNLFGSGFDLECYVGYPLSYFKNFYGTDLVCKGNATECMLYVPPVVDAVAAIPAQNIFMKNVHFEQGVNGASLYGFSMYANSYVGTKYGIDTVHLSGFVDGQITSNNVKGFVYTEGFLKVSDAALQKAVFNNGKDFTLTVPSNNPNIRVETFGALTTVTNTGVGALTAGISQYVKSNGKHNLNLEFSVGGGLISGGNMSWTITLPTGIKVDNASINAYNTVAGKAVISSVLVLDASNIRIFITPIDDAINGFIKLDVNF